MRAEVAVLGSAIETVGTQLFDLPPHSPGFNPVENTFAEREAMLRRVAACTLPDL